MKKILFLLLLITPTLTIKSFSQQQPSSSFIHNLSIGFNPVGSADVTSVGNGWIFSPMFGVRYNFTDHLVAEANTYRILSFNKSNPVHHNYSNLYLGLEGRFKISNKFKLLAGIYGGYSYYHYYYNEDDRQTTTGIGPIVGLEYKLSPKFYLLSESTIIYGPYREVNDGFHINSYNTFSFPKFWSLEIFYRF